MDFGKFFRFLKILWFFGGIAGLLLLNPAGITGKAGEDKISLLYNNISSISVPKTSQTPPRLYKRLSRFEELYGFPFEGPRLAEWIKKRIHKINIGERWTAAVYEGGATITVEAAFFELPFEDQLYILVHEARHADGDGFHHVKCPGDYLGVSAGQPDMDLTRLPGCDPVANGAYAFQAALLFELYAYGLGDWERAGLLYNSSIGRIIPLQ